MSMCEQCQIVTRARTAMDHCACLLTMPPDLGSPHDGTAECICPRCESVRILRATIDEVDDDRALRRACREAPREPEPAPKAKAKRGSKLATGAS